MTDHTKEPWHWDSDPIKCDPLDRVRFRVTAVGRTITQMYYSSGDPVAEADARRIVACVNACAGIANPSDYDFARVLKLADEQRAACLKYEQQRDELATILRQVRGDMDAEDVLFPWWAVIDAALAKVKQS